MKKVQLSTPTLLVYLAVPFCPQIAPELPPDCPRIATQLPPNCNNKNNNNNNNINNNNNNRGVILPFSILLLKFSVNITTMNSVTTTITLQVLLKVPRSHPLCVQLRFAVHCSKSNCGFRKRKEERRGEERGEERDRKTGGGERERRGGWGKSPTKFRQHILASLCQ